VTVIKKLEGVFMQVPISDDRTLRQLQTLEVTVIEH